MLDFYILVCTNSFSDLSNPILNLQDSFYHTLTPEELTKVHEYNFDHPG